MNFINSRLLFGRTNIINKFFLPVRQKIHVKNILSQCIKVRTNTTRTFYHTNTTARSKTIVGYWLLTCSGMVFIAVALGGITRLTESGLSMVTWKFLGEKMPLDELSWVNEFEKYKQFPEFQITNKDMTLEEFKRIWWMEYAHRMWGRLIGAAFVLPASYFWMKNMFTPVVKKRVLAFGALIGFQGLLGWYMVKSGLENKFDGPCDVPRVSQYRLASHLGMAFILYSGFLYAALDHLVPVKRNIEDCFSSQTVQARFNKFKRFKYLVYSSKGLVFLTAIAGAFVAGLDAGLIYNTFPKMSDKWIPDEMFLLTPTTKNFTENPATVQFMHRLLAMFTLSLVTYIGLKSRKFNLSRRAHTAALAVLGTAYLQATLGIFTLLNHVPTHLAALHQSGSLLLFSTVVWLCHEIRHVKRLPK